MWLDLFFKFLLLLRGPRGMEVFFFLHLICGKGKVGGLVFFFKTFFHC
jgi:hypothetical protein